MRIVLADDHPIYRKGIAALLGSIPGYVVVDEVENAADLRLSVDKHRPDLVLLDYRMPGSGSISALEYLKSRFTGIKIIVLTGVQSESVIQQLVNSKADGVLLKDSGGELIAEAIETVMKGERYFSASVQQIVAHESAQLSKREFQVLELIVEGLVNAEISERLNISAKTVENHRYRLMQKLGTKNTAGIIRYARKHGLFES